MSEFKVAGNIVGYKTSVPIGISSNSPSLVNDIVIYPNNFVIDATLTLNGDVIWEEKNIKDTCFIPLEK